MRSAELPNKAHLSCAKLCPIHIPVEVIYALSHCITPARLFRHCASARSARPRVFCLAWISFSSPLGTLTRKQRNQKKSQRNPALCAGRISFPDRRWHNFPTTAPVLRLGMDWIPRSSLGNLSGGSLWDKSYKVAISRIVVCREIYIAICEIFLSNFIRRCPFRV
jgi:hypothetical protein